MSSAADARLAPLRDSLAGTVLRGTDDVTYHLRECIGEGGQGWVFRANYDEPTGHVVIVKVLRPDVIAGEALQRFRREADVLRMLSQQGRPNPYIVRFYDHAIAHVPSPFGKEPLTLAFTVLEHVNGTTLEKVLDGSSGRGLPVERVRRLLRQICQALDVVHAQKVVHRDLKPSNILLATEAGTEIAKVTDFGLVKLVDVDLQKTTALAGASLGYAPPEQYEKGNKRVSPRTDVFSLAAVAFEMLAGRPAFPFTERENPLVIVSRILTGAPPMLTKTAASLSRELAVRPELVEALDRELGRALSSDPGARHESIMAFWTAIEPSLRAASGGSMGAMPAASPAQAPAQAQAQVQVQVHADADEDAVRGSGKTVLAVETEPAARAPGPAAPALPAAPNAAPAVVRAAPDTSDRAAWKWTLLTPPVAPRSLRAAIWTRGPDAAVAVTTSGIVRWEGGAWVPKGTPPRVSVGAIRGLRHVQEGLVLAFGERALGARFAPGNAATLLEVPDPEITFHGALVEESGTTTLVGERPYRGGARRAFAGNTAGVVAQFAGDRLTVVADAVHCACLRSVTRLADGRLIACGNGGALARIERGAVEYLGSICGGHLLDIAPMPDGGVVTVGTGGHALRLGPKLEPALEAVQTTKDVVRVTTTEDGRAWAGAVAGRLLRRTPGEPPTWVRMTGDIGTSSSLLDVWVGPRSVRVIGDDGAVVEGRIA